MHRMRWKRAPHPQKIFDIGAGVVFYVRAEFMNIAFLTMQPVRSNGHTSVWQRRNLAIGNAGRDL